MKDAALYDDRAFVAFMRMKDPTETYTFMSQSNCAVHQYLRHVGVEEKDLVQAYLDAPEHWGETAADGKSPLAQRDLTWGGLLKRAERDWWFLPRA